MLKKLLTLSLATVMLSVTCLAAPADIAVFNTVTAEASEPEWTYAESVVTSVTEGTTEHLKALTPWDGEATSQPAVGDGLATTPYQISNGAELAWFANHVNTENAAACADLTSDINLGGQNWTDFGIGVNADVAYTGTFDGKGHTIYNLTDVDTDNTGLFEYINGATLKNFNIENAKITAGTTNNNSASSSAIVCSCMNAGTISNVSVSGTINAASGKYANQTGSIVGYMRNGTVEKCYSDATIDLSTGGTTVLGYNASASVNYGVGGIVGVFNKAANTQSYIQNCGFAGMINAPYSSKVGGILGSTKTAYYNIVKCYNTADITGYAQVAGILGWDRGGADTSSTVTNGIYNTGNITAKSTTNTYAAGLINGTRGGMLANYAYSTGDVIVGSKENDQFNNYCALLYTCVPGSKTNNWNSAKAVYQTGYTYGSENTAKHILSATGTPTTTATNIIGYTAAQLTDGTTAVTRLGENFAKDTGINNGYPISAWQTTAPLTDANTYYVKDGSIALTLAEAGYVSLDITPLGDNVTVTVGTEAKEITAKGKYLFAAPQSATAAVSGAALIKVDLMNQANVGGTISALEATAIKAAITGDAGKTIVLALFDGATLEKVEYAANVTQAIIDLRAADVEGCTLKAFVWENDTLVPTDIAFPVLD